MAYRSPMDQSPPVALTIAGSDSCAGAGLQADLKTFGALGVHGLTVVTVVVAETPLEVTEIHELPVAVIQEQLSLLLEAYPVSAVKTGMLYSKAQVVAVADLLAGTKIPLVVDPVMIATSGTALISDDAIDAVRDRLIPEATLVTPNYPEALALLKQKDGSPEDVVERLAKALNCSVLLTGGHDPQGQSARDLLWDSGKMTTYEGEWLDLPSSHGTGCTISAAITAALANGAPLPEAVQIGKDFVTEALRNAFCWDRGAAEPLVALNQANLPASAARR